MVFEISYVFVYASNDDRHFDIQVVKVTPDGATREAQGNERHTMLLNVSVGKKEVTFKSFDS